MKRYWLTVHWPMHEDDQGDNNYVWLQAKYVRVGADMHRGDMVAVCEYCGGPAEIREGQRVRCRRCAHGVVWYGEVVKKFRPRIENRFYEDGATIAWVRWNEVSILNRNGFVPYCRNVDLTNWHCNRILCLVD